MSTQKDISPSGCRKNEGATIIIVALLLVVFVAFTALAVDVAHLYVVKNELQNAADAGALAGARVLYNNNGTSVNTDANGIAYAAAMANKSEGLAVDVNWNSGENTGDVQRGHWSFSSGTFSSSNETGLPDIWTSTTAQLDNNPNFVNAVQVITRRSDTQAHSFFARALGFFGFDVTAKAIAYIGFAGSLNPLEVDQPIAICKQSITNADGSLTCNLGRMSNSGSNAETHNTTAWTNFTSDCTTANPSNVGQYICGSGNPEPIIFGNGIGSTGGEISNIMVDLRTCFDPSTRTTPWEMTLPVIDCPGNNPGNCSTVLGAVKISIVWISDKAADTSKELEKEGFPPTQMGHWTCKSECNNDPLCCWGDFVSETNGFNLKTVDGAPAPYDKRVIYFIPSCEPVEPAGLTGGQNFGVLAKIPVLVD